MNFRERVQSLTNRTPEARKQILAKLREYETLKPDERELRLKVTELRWYLYPLMRAPATNRAALLARVPAADRELVENRLSEWDKLSPEAQKELLQNEAVIRCLSDVPAGAQRSRDPAPAAGEKSPTVAGAAGGAAAEAAGPLRPVLPPHAGGEGKGPAHLVRA